MILANHFRVPELNPFLANRASALWGLKIANRRFETICANCTHVMKIGLFYFQRIDLRESPRFALRIAGPSKR